DLGRSFAAVDSDVEAFGLVVTLLKREQESAVGCARNPIEGETNLCLGAGGMRRQQECKRKNRSYRKTADWHVPLPNAVSDLWKFSRLMHEPAGQDFLRAHFIR